MLLHKVPSETPVFSISDKHKMCAMSLFRIYEDRYACRILIGRSGVHYLQLRDNFGSTWDAFANQDSWYDKAIRFGYTPADFRQEEHLKGGIAKQT